MSFHGAFQEEKRPGDLHRLASLFSGGDDGVRTHDLRLAKPALSQLSYVPLRACVATTDKNNNRPSGDSANAGATIVRKSGGPDKVRTCDLPVISRTL